MTAAVIFMARSVCFGWFCSGKRVCLSVPRRFANGCKWVQMGEYLCKSVEICEDFQACFVSGVRIPPSPPVDYQGLTTSVCPECALSTPVSGQKHSPNTPLQQPGTDHRANCEPANPPGSPGPAPETAGRGLVPFPDRPGSRLGKGVKRCASERQGPFLVFPRPTVRQRFFTRLQPRGPVTPRSGNQFQTTRRLPACHQGRLS